MDTELSPVSTVEEATASNKVNIFPGNSADSIGMTTPSFAWQELLSESTGCVVDLEEGRLTDDELENSGKRSQNRRRTEKPVWAEFVSDPSGNLSGEKGTGDSRQRRRSGEDGSRKAWENFMSTSHPSEGGEGSSNLTPVSSNADDVAEKHVHSNDVKAVASGIRADKRSQSSMTGTRSDSGKPAFGGLDFAARASSAPPREEVSGSLPVRPLTIGDSTTMGNSLGYQPISPFNADLYPPRTASSTPVVTTLPSMSQLSEVDAEVDERESDMTGRERLQPLGRDGLEVKQGPPWGITMPLFQPNSRKSSFSSLDSGKSSNGTPPLVQQQTTSVQTTKTDTESALPVVTAGVSDDRLSVGSSTRSLESKKPMAAKALNGVAPARTRVAQFRQRNPADVDSPVSQILGSTFKATQKILEELKRRPLGVYNEETEQRSLDEKESSEAKGAVNDNERFNLSTERGDNREDECSADLNPSQNCRNLEKTPKGQINYLDNQALRVSEMSSGLERWSPAVNTSSGNHSRESGLGSEPRLLLGNSGTSTQTSSSFRDANNGQGYQRLVDEGTVNLQPRVGSWLLGTDNTQTNADPPSWQRSDELHRLTGFSTERDKQRRNGSPVGLDQRTDPRLLSQNNSQTNHSFGESPQRDEFKRLQEYKPYETNVSHKTSGLTDSTLGNSVAIPEHIEPANNMPTPDAVTHVGSKSAERPAVEDSDRESLSWENVLEVHSEPEGVSEFDRIAEQSISWSNTVANRFREELKSADLLDQGTLLDNASEVDSVTESALTESTTNDELFRPKGLQRLSSESGPVGIYDVRQSSGPGSTNRKRMALGQLPRTGSRPVVLGAVYVSEGTTGNSGTEMNDRDMEKRPEGESDPKSDDVRLVLSGNIGQPTTETNRNYSESSTTVSGTPTIDWRVLSMDSGIPSMSCGIPTLGSGISSMGSRIPTTGSGIPVMDSGIPTMGSGIPTKSSSITRTQPSAALENTWSISTPVMSQLDTRTTARMNQEANTKPRSRSNQNKPGSVSSSNHARKRSPRRKDQDWNPTKTTRQRETTPSSEIFSSDHTHHAGSGARHVKKSVADIILENFRREEEEQKRRRKRLEELKQSPTTQDLNALWDRFQEFLGKNARKPEGRKFGRALKGRTSQRTPPSGTSLHRTPLSGTPSHHTPLSDPSSIRTPPIDSSSTLTPPSQTSVASGSDVTVTEDRKHRPLVDLTTDSDEEFERFLRRVREIQSSDSASVTSRGHSDDLRRQQYGQRAKPRGRHHHKVGRRDLVPESSDQAASTSQRSSLSSVESKTFASNENDVTPTNEKISEATVPLSLPMWLAVKNQHPKKKTKGQSERSKSMCTCGASSRTKKTTSTSYAVRDVGVNCPTPPAVARDTNVVPRDANYFPRVTNFLSCDTNHVPRDTNFLPRETNFVPPDNIVAQDRVDNTKIDLLKNVAADVNQLIDAPPSLVRLSLQDAFLYSKQEFIERSRKRVRNIKERRSEKTGGGVIVVPTEKTKPKMEKRTDDKTTTNKPLKVYDQLAQRKPRPMTQREIREVNRRTYKNLPEVKKQRDDHRRAEFYKTNRLRAQLYGKPLTCTRFKQVLDEVECDMKNY